MAEMRFLIVVLDALRPEFVTPELMPNLSAFAAAGVRFANARSTFPTETRVNQSAVTTGCYPRRHGVVANQFPLPASEAAGAPREVLNTGKDELFEAALRQLKGRLIGVPTLGEILAGAGRLLATVSAGTSGGGRLINLHAETTGSFRLALHRPAAAVPPGVFEAVTSLIGRAPEYAVPGLAWNSYAINCYLDFVEPVVRPDVMLLWLSEPDESFHYCGIGAPETLGALRYMDRRIGHLLGRRRAEIEAGRLQVVIMSDHGQISLEGDKLDLVARLGEAGFRAGATVADDPDYVVAVHTGGGIWVRDHDPALIAKLVAWLQQQHWCGPVFTRDGTQGTLTHAELCVDHPRTADVVLALAHGDGNNRWGRAGLSADNSPYPEQGGCHGGLSRYELENFIAIGGSAFREGTVIETPAANVDILPTVLKVLGVPLGHTIDGRVLSEALAESEAAGEVAGAPREIGFSSTNAEGRRTHLSATEYGGVRYLDRAWAE